MVEYFYRDVGIYKILICEIEEDCKDLASFYHGAPLWSY